MVVVNRYIKHMANAHVFISTPALVAVMGFHMFMDITPPSYSLSAVIGST